MKFILWTVVWFTVTLGYDLLDKIVEGTANYHARYSDDVLAIAQLIYLILWIVLYHTIIKKETE